MPRIQALELDQVDAKTRGLLENVHKALGTIPNLMKTLAHSPVALEIYLGFGQALGRGRLSAGLREKIALAVSGANRCEYCIAAHAALGKKFGVDEAELRASMEGRSSDAKTQAALAFALSIVSKNGWVSDEDTWISEEIVDTYLDQRVLPIWETSRHIATDRNIRVQFLKLNSDRILLTCQMIFRQRLEQKTGKTSISL